MTKARIVKNPRTDADVELLMAVFPDVLPDGREIRHEQVEAVIKLPRVASRYRTVTNKWRRRLERERRVVLDGQLAEGRGFIALTPDEMIRYGTRRQRSAGRLIKRSLAVMAIPVDDELSEGPRKQRAILQAAMERVLHDSRGALRDISKALAPPRQLPRVVNE